MHPTTRRWPALYVLCLATLMIVLDSSVVAVALPSIRDSLGFTQAGLSWVINAYILTFGGFLLLGGRLGDLFGHRLLFLIGVVLFTIASLACAVAPTATALIVARGVQGIGGAIAEAVALSLIVNLFPEPGERAKAMGITGFVASGGGAIGALLGGVLTGLLNWHWIFLINLPIGLVVCVLAMKWVPESDAPATRQRLDIGGAFTVTAALMLAVRAIVGGNDAGWTSVTTLGMLGAALAFAVAFVVIETRVASPLVPLGMLARRNLATANIIGILWAASMFAWFFISALYLQLVLGKGPLEVGLAFLPANLLMGALSVGVSGRLVTRFGMRKPLIVVLALAAAGLALFSQIRADGDVLRDIMPAMLLLGGGAGIAFNPVLLAAMTDASPEESGLASGIVNTSFQLGGALGLAILASVASYQTGVYLADGASQAEALTAGYRAAFLIGAIFAVLAAALGFVIREDATTVEEREAMAVHA